MIKNKKIKGIIIALVVIAILVGIIIFLFWGKDDEVAFVEEYTPQEEISSQQMRETIVTLYFLNSETKELKSEGKLVDAAVLIQNPYKLIVGLLIEGPKSEKLQNVFPENTRILDASIEEGCVTLNFSEEILKFEDDVQKYNIINSILNSLTGLNEVNSMKILVNNEKVKEFDEEYTAIY